jgi:hypothetical protein
MEEVMPNAWTTNELYVESTNEAGSFARCTVSLRENNINIEAFCAYSREGNNAAFHLITTDNDKAREWLTKNGYNVEERPVVCWSATNQPGTLNRGCSAMAEKGVNINYAYGSAGQGNQNSWVVFSTTNNQETESTLNNL